MINNEIVADLIKLAIMFITPLVAVIAGMLAAYVAKRLKAAGIDIDAAQMELLRTACHDAIAAVEKKAAARMKINSEMAGEDKKKLALEIAADLARKLKVPEDKIKMADNMIEAILGHQMSPVSDEDHNHDDDDHDHN